MYIPKGEYLISKPLNIPDNVVLIGDFVAPNSKKPRSEGTVIVADETEATLSSPLITLGDNSGLSDLSICYKAQSYSEIKKYPYTIMQSSGKSAQITNVAMLNSYSGICAASASAEELYIDKIYITAISNAIRIDNCTKKLTVRNVFVTPLYWINDQSTPKNEDFSTEKVNDAIYSELSAITLYNVGNVFLDSISVDTAQKALTIDTPYSSEGHIVVENLSTSNTLNPVNVRSAPAAGIGFSLCSLRTSDLLNTYAVEIAENFVSAIAFNTCSFPGSPSVSVKSAGSGRLSFQNCEFISWRQQALELNDIIFTSVSSFFNAEGDVLKKNERTVGLFGLDHIVSPVAAEDVFEIKTENEYTLSAIEKSWFTQSGAAPIFDKTVYNAVDYGLTTGIRDNTSALQSAINYAYSNGGGVVFVPAGEYTFSSTVKLKKGVSVYGVGSGLNASTSTVFITNTDPAKESFFIECESDCIVSDITVSYSKTPDLTDSEFVTGSSAIGAIGQKNIFINNVLFIGPAYGVNLSECENATVLKSGGTALFCGIRLKECISVNGKNLILGDKYAAEGVSAFRQNNCSDVYVYGGSAISLSNIDCGNADYGVYLNAEDVPIVPSNPDLALSGLFAKDVYASVAVNKYPYAVVSDICSKPKIFSTNAYHVTTFYGNNGKLSVYDLFGSGEVTGGVYTRSGNVDVQSSFFASLGKSAIINEGATTVISGSILLDNDCTYHVEASSGTTYLLCNILNNTADYEGIESKYVRRSIGSTAIFADDGNIKGK